jgi:L-seryl-tRNA(Ser) seleniumtransferase
MSPAQIKSRAAAFARTLRSKAPAGTRVELCDGHSVIGGGSCPGSHLSTTLVAVDSAAHRPKAVESALRAQSPPVIVRLEADRALIDLRTVFPAQESTLRNSLLRVLE